MKYTFQMVATIDADGRLLIPNKAEWREFLRINAGRKIQIDAEAFTITDTAQTKKYYFGYVLPKIQAGFIELGDRRTVQDINQLLKGEYEIPFDSIDDLDSLKFHAFMGFVKQYAAENLGVVINDPN